MVSDTAIEAVGRPAVREEAGVEAVLVRTQNEDEDRSAALETHGGPA